MESVCRGNSTEGSNPSLSANLRSGFARRLPALAAKPRRRAVVAPMRVLVGKPTLLASLDRAYVTFPRDIRPMTRASTGRKEVLRSLLGAAARRVASPAYQRPRGASARLPDCADDLCGALRESMPVASVQTARCGRKVGAGRVAGTGRFAGRIGEARGRQLRSAGDQHVRRPFGIKSGSPRGYGERAPGKSEPPRSRCGARGVWPRVGLR